MTIRDVRPTDDFYRDLDRALTGAGQGGISRADFGLYVLPGIMRRFAADWDRLSMPVPGRADYRVDVGISPHLGRYSIQGQLTWDGVVELISFCVDTEGLIDPEGPTDDM